MPTNNEIELLKTNLILFFEKYLKDFHTQKYMENFIKTLEKEK